MLVNIMDCCRVTCNKWCVSRYSSAYPLCQCGITGVFLRPISPNNFSLRIKIPWKVHFVITQLLIIRTLQIFAHGMTAVLSCHVQNFVAISLLFYGLSVGTKQICHWILLVKWAPGVLQGPCSIVSMVAAGTSQPCHQCISSCRGPVNKDG